MKWLREAFQLLMSVVILILLYGIMSVCFAVLAFMVHGVLLFLFGPIPYISLNLILGYLLGTWFVILYRPFKKPVLHESRLSRLVGSAVPIALVDLYWVYLWVPLLIRFGFSKEIV